MKKLIAISVMLALVAGAVFAQVGGGVETRFTTAEWDNHGGRARTGGTVATSFIGLSGQNEEGTLGGTIRFRYEDLVRLGGGGENDVEHTGNYHKAFVWWKPIPQLKIFLGAELDGLFGTDDLQGWAYHKGSEGYINNHDWGYWRTIFPGNWDRFGLALSVYPIDGLDINVIVPTGHGSWDHATTAVSNDAKWRVSELYFNGLIFQVNYALSGIGKVHLTWYGKNAVEAVGEEYWYADMDNQAVNHDNSDAYDGQKTKGVFAASFLLTAIDGLQANVGFSTILVNKDNWAGAESPLNIGFGAAYTHESGFGAKTRGAYLINVKGAKDATQFLINVMPYYNLGSLTAFCDVGFTFDGQKGKTAKYGDEVAVPWYINPYITVPLSGGKFQAGIKINGSGKTKGNDDQIGVSIPLLLGYNF